MYRVGAFVVCDLGHAHRNMHNNKVTRQGGSSEDMNRDFTLPPIMPPDIPRHPYLSIVIIDKGVIQDVPSTVISNSIPGGPQLCTILLQAQSNTPDPDPLS